MFTAQKPKYFERRRYGRTMLGELLSLLSLLSSVAAQGIPGDYILLVTPNCGATTADTTNITLVNDFDVTAAGLCSGGMTKYFTGSDNDVVHTLIVYTPSTGNASQCKFEKKTNAEVYTIVIEISYGEPGSFVHTQQQTYLITCSYDSNGLNIGESASRNIIKPYIAPTHIQDNKGASSTASFALEVRDVLNRPITGPIQLGRKIQLYAELTGGDGSEKGLRTVACSAISASMSFDVIRGGCGDGVVFGQTAGFTTLGLKVHSPYFRAFRLSAGSSIQFICNFTVCTTSCGGSSCANERRKRDAHISNAVLLDNGVVELTSLPLHVETNTCPYGPAVHKGELLIAAGQVKPAKSSFFSYTYMMIMAVAAVSVMACSICFGAMLIKNRKRDTTVTIAEYKTEIITPAQILNKSTV